MKFLKYILYTLLGIVAIVLISAAFLPKEKTFSSELVINKPKQEIYDFVKYLKNQEQFSFFFLSDPNIQSTYSGTDGTVGSSCSWISKEMGDGTQTITKLIDGESVESELSFGMGEPAHSFITLKEETDNQAKVHYGTTMKAPYPFNIMLQVMPMDHAFETSLKTLQSIVEAPVVE